MTTREIDLEIQETEQKLKELKKFKRKMVSINDVKELFYDKMIDTINDVYEAYRMTSVYELIAVPYDNTRHMLRWMIYTTDDPNKLNKTVMNKLDAEWANIYRKAVLKGTKNRVIGIKNKNGEIQVSDDEMMAIKEIARQSIDQLLEDWFGS